MILAIDRESVLHVFESESDAQREIETIDIENNEYDFCDDRGRKLIAEITSPVTTFRGGEFNLVPAAQVDSGLPISFFNRARELGNTCHGISSLDDLRSALKSPS